mmetsp:Transcript_115964/g.237110  ORF Transcript_115964/g.237110 Transcript_115964/m.237110 type:complete len:733 (-) Transcript_115964:88-2286(-)
MGASSRFAALLLVVPLVARAVEQQEAALAAANPIRKVVTMLQAMQTKVSEEGEKEKELYEKFMCYCKNSGGDLKASISAAETKAPALTTEIEEAEALHAQTSEELKTAQADREAAKAAMAEATGIREKEAAAYASEKGEADANIGALMKAVAALEKGMAAGFLQTNAAQILKRFLQAKQDMSSDDRQNVLAFLEGTHDGTGYVPQGGEIVGILKQMGDEMNKGLAEATAAEEAAIQDYEGLMEAKTHEIKALTASIETKTRKVGELAMEIAEKKNELGDTQEALEEDKKFLADLEKGCSTKTAEWEERTQTRSDELAALAETIKVLNDDDALDLFKKTLPGSASSFMQLETRSATSVRMSARAQLQAVRRTIPGDRPRLDLIALALRGKKIGFSKVLEMIDAMVATLKKEQTDDDSKKTYCGAQFDLSDDKKKDLERALADSEAAIASTTDNIATLKEEIAALQAGIKALDKSVAEATEQRKNEHEAFSELMASDSAAKELLGFAKNRLNKFYNPKLYKPPPKRELSREDRIVVNMGGTAPPTTTPGGIAGTGITVFAEVSAHEHRRSNGQVAPPPPPETFGAYTTKSAENTGVLAMIDLLVKDLTKEMTEAETEEKDAQSDYEAMMTDSAEKRTADSKSVAAKESAKADLEGALEQHTDDKASTSKDLTATLEYIQSLHAECDWLLQYFDARKDARTSEIDSLGQAKAVLSGADYSLLQTQVRSRGFLSRS